MKALKLTLVLLVVAGSVFSLSYFVLRRATSETPVADLKASDRGWANKRIAAAQQLIEQFPDKADGYNQLAAGYMQKARETTDLSFNDKAQSALTQSFALEPDNYDAIKLQAKLQLTFHRFQEALATTQRAQKVRTDDHDVWGQITDANVELGNYAEAVKAAQRMVDLRPDTASYSRISYLRSLHGDTKGAIQAMAAAVRAANPNDPEGLAWCRVQLGNELMNAGKLQEAESEFDAALKIFPNYRMASEAKARVRLAAGDLQTALKMFEAIQTEDESADGALILGDLYTHLGKADEALKHYQLFETLERDNAATENSWRHMINYWLDRDLELGQALALAQREYESRKDIYTCDSLAWALFKNGKVAEATAMMDEALRLGTRDARINYHAGVIYRAMNLKDKAREHLTVAAAVNSSFDLIQAANAKKMLAD